MSDKIKEQFDLLIKAEKKIKNYESRVSLMMKIISRNNIKKNQVEKEYDSILTEIVNNKEANSISRTILWLDYKDVDYKKNQISNESYLELKNIINDYINLNKEESKYSNYMIDFESYLIDYFYKIVGVHYNDDKAYDKFNDLEINLKEELEEIIDLILINNIAQCCIKKDFVKENNAQIL